MTPEEQLDEARAEEAYRQWQEEGGQWTDSTAVSVIAARLAREGWTPPEPVVDPDVLAFREWYADGTSREHREDIFAGVWDQAEAALGFLAGARMATERERERAKVLVEYLEDDRGIPAHAWRLAKYRGEA